MVLVETVEESRNLVEINIEPPETIKDNSAAENTNVRQHSNSVNSSSVKSNNKYHIPDSALSNYNIHSQLDLKDHDYHT